MGTLVDPGDEVILTDPHYACYPNFIQFLDGIPKSIPVSEEDGFQYRTEAIRKALTSKTRAILINSPANPTGNLLEADRMAEIAQLGPMVFSDEIYHGLDYASPAVSAAEVADDVLVINSFSKYFCMTGWRVGWMVVPPGLSRTMERLQQNFSISVPTLSQVAAEAAFDGTAEMDAVKRGYEENRRILSEGLPTIGLEHFLPADGAFYLYADVSRFTGDSHAFAIRLLDSAHVAATPGVDFDPFRGKQFLRLSYAGSPEQMREAVVRIGAFLAKE